MRLIAAMLMVLAAGGALAVAWPANAQIELVEADPPDGSTAERPPKVRMCFSERILGDFEINYLLPDGSEAGVRVAFDPNGECLEVEAIEAEGAPGGQYALEWQVTAEESGETASGVLNYQVGEEGQPLPTPTPEPSPEAQPATPSPEGTPAPTESPGGDGAAGGGGTDGSGGQDILPMALITAAVVGGLAVVGLVLYQLRRVLGFDWHRPTPGGQEGGEGH